MSPLAVQAPPQEDGPALARLFALCVNGERGLPNVGLCPTIADIAIENPLFQIVGDDDVGPEEDQLELIEDLRPAGGKGARVSLRLPPRLVLYIGGLAETNGRSFAAECQAALEAHEALSRLSAVMDQELQARRKRESGGIHGVTGENAERFAERLRDELGEIWSKAFSTRSEQRRFADRLLGWGDPRPGSDS